MAIVLMAVAMTAAEAAQSDDPKLMPLLQFLHTARRAGTTFDETEVCQ